MVLIDSSGQRIIIPDTFDKYIPEDKMWHICNGFCNWRSLVPDYNYDKEFDILRNLFTKHLESNDIENMRYVFTSLDALHRTHKEDIISSKVKQDA